MCDIAWELLLEKMMLFCTFYEMLAVIRKDDVIRPSVNNRWVEDKLWVQNDVR